MTDEELVAMLRNQPSDPRDGDPDPDLLEAADRIDALRAEVANFKSALKIIESADIAIVAQRDEAAGELAQAHEDHAELVERYAMLEECNRQLKAEVARLMGERTEHTAARELYEKWTESGLKTIEEQHRQLALCHAASASALDLREKALDMARRLAAKVEELRTRLAALRQQQDAKLNNQGE
ncbi:MAG: hypothetical protein WC655_23640 [Candidatus Hydrogenedentales bacterium]|jgi:hypothetical protein